LRAASAYGIFCLALRLVWAEAWRRPRPVTVAERVAALPAEGLPLDAMVEIRWSDQLVPFIDARSDHDLAVALGLVHAHLRLAQMEAMRRVATGRLAEVLGPAAVPLDHAVRTLDLGRAVPAICAALPDETRQWLAAFVAGINHHLAEAASPPPEFRLLGITAQPWQIEDVVAVARLAAADVTWLLMLRLLRLRRRSGSGWPAIWAQLLGDGSAMPGKAAGDDADLPAAFLARLALGVGCAGSNALAVAGRRSVTGRPFLAGDPHLTLSLPSPWLAAAYRSPSYNLAGLMIPGIPLMAIGRNRHLAWGGTNLMAASSELFDVSALPQSEIGERRVRLQVRWSRPRDVVLRETRCGPIVSDAPPFAGRSEETLALRWAGHTPSDEISAVLAINRARNIAELRRAAEGLAVPGQNLVFADRDGRIGHLRAAWLPRRPASRPADLISPLATAADWARLANAADLPAETDPARGFVVSANDRPPQGEMPIGWFFAPDDRADRLFTLLRASERIGLAELAALQADVAAPRLLALRDRLAAALDPAPACPLFDAFLAWDGSYDADSAGALAFELVVARLIATALPPPRQLLYDGVWHGRKLLTEEIAGLPPEQLAAALRSALAAARPVFRRLRCWGGAHRLRLAHPLGLLPPLGRQFPGLDWDWPGSDTLFAAAHAPVRGRHAALYGSNARYIFDLSDPDANRVVILGGQDGVPGSVAFCDQAALFRRGEYVELPLEPATARHRFPHSSVLQPARS
jgi:penicillin amidase